MNGSMYSAIVGAWLFLAGTAMAQAPVALALDTSEADEALRILDKSAAHEPVTTADWNRLFATRPYQWLKAREAAMGRPLSDEDFQRFLLSPEAAEQRLGWASTLAAMKQADMARLGAGVLAWLPTGASIHAQVFPEIKPQRNSFVWKKPAAAAADDGGGPAIFLAVNRQSRDQFENTVAHECHHIGLESLAARQEELQAGLPANVKRAVNWLSAFGEGEAMLAAAGADRHPHWEDDAPVRARWDGDMQRFATDLEAVQQLLLDILDDKLTQDADIMKRAAPFWGDAQGAWYTVGYEMAVLVEKRFGRAAFNDCLLDPRKLLELYNQVAQEANAHGARLATWSPDLLKRLQGA
ncbi:DUF5700 domain-containing putative Zn-dependent protease [Nitrospirillum amazonense]|uniref:Zn-dependent protease DUF2268 n=1 Tax=Nitrospirillum amazonense TaxID=28077 RepID=A0A560JFK5_9PROT|nr:DUF5700 domain-containing putative Zn-dependent protease [Nitrospirillum amazonense]MDG3439396.1 hypothetical protein [Nitrospirillum amazonense]TWB69816.1 hypothetical protein FBZ87_108106 [Nitrospirillum amazonense]